MDKAHPIESEKFSYGNTSFKLNPTWMKPNYAKSISVDVMKPTNYYDIFRKRHTRQLVDKDNLKNKSIFSIMDYRHNVPSKEEYIKYQEGIPLRPKQFFCWDDGKVYDPKKKRDYV